MTGRSRWAPKAARLLPIPVAVCPGCRLHKVRENQKCLRNVVRMTFSPMRHPVCRKTDQPLVNNMTMQTPNAHHASCTVHSQISQLRPKVVVLTYGCPSCLCSLIFLICPMTVRASSILSRSGCSETSCLSNCSYTLICFSHAYIVP